MRLVVVASHPVQYQAPLFRELAKHCDLKVLFAHRATRSDQAEAGFGVAFDWDVDLLSGYDHRFLDNVARAPSLSRFSGCDAPGVGQAIHDFSPDAVVVMGWHLKCYWQAIRAARRRRIAVLVRGDSHLETPRSRLKRAAKALLYPPALRVFDAALYVGQHSKAYWLHYRFPLDRLFFSPHCVDNEWFAARATDQAREELRQSVGIDQNAFVVLFAGKLTPLKQPLDLVQAAARCRTKGALVEILIAGAGELEGAIAEAAKAYDTPVRMLGFCNQSRMPAVYAASDLLALPSRHETWGLVANEALACARPVLVSDACGCAPDLAADGATGRWFRTGDVGDLAEKIEAVFRAPPSRQAIAETAERYSLHAAADGVLRAVRALRPPAALE